MNNFFINIRSKALCTVLSTLLFTGCVTTTVKNSQNISDASIVKEDPLKEALFHQWFAGEFDNYEQNWQDKINAEKDSTIQLHDHIHHIFAPISMPALTGETYFVKQYMDGDKTKVYRQRLYQFVRNEEKGVLQLNIYRFKDEAKYAFSHLKPELFAHLTTDELSTYPGCEVYWKFTGEYFDGYMDHNACSIVSSRSGKKLFFNDKLRLLDGEIWIDDSAIDEDGKHIFGNKQGIAHKNRKVTYFTGWGGNRIGGKDAAEDAKWHFTSKILIHNEGQIFPLIDDKTGEKSEYSVQLAKLTYQNTKDPILKFGLIDNKTGKTITYIWSEQDNKKIGMNLRWMQSGIKVKETRPHFSF
ncbi:chromophore lyase CpcT/CpeT [Pseudocolwellia agarivorans]|uniref:chromophore lyase CpcT/CpeT n=1 Tax=Pseudocolwellia agarivorans TaxID=1911682 RepID=UPI000987148C|nr:chromophore lyase CpcT/CpeT [Pseudocolwellia agarivorans]